MDKANLITKTEAFAFALARLDDPGHDEDHIKRVRKLSLAIAEEYECDAFLVELLALLHDVEDDKFNHNASVVDFLSSADMPQELKDKILFILPRLSFHVSPLLPEDFPIEGKIVADADRLDAMGAIGVARAFSYGGKHGRKMYGDKDSTISHFEAKLLHLDKHLHLDISKQLAKKRQDFLRAYYEEFLNEIG